MSTTGATESYGEPACSVSDPKSQLYSVSRVPPRGVRSSAPTGGTTTLTQLREASRRVAASRLGVAIVCGLVVASYIAVSYAVRLPPGEAHDFTVHWHAARALLNGENPYESLHIGSRTIYSGRYYYPLTATLLAVPVAWLPLKASAAVFSAVGATLFAYALGRERWRVAALLSAPMLSTAAAGQNTAYVAAAAFMPALGWLIAIKPNVGLAVFAMRPSRATVLGVLLFVAVSLAISPSWPREWLRAVNNDLGMHTAPVSLWGGPVMLLALARWRRPEARLLATLSLVPHTMTWYDALPLMLIPATFRELLVLGIISHLATFIAVPLGLRYDGAALLAASAPIALWGLYVPALVLVMRRPNEGDLPEWLERLASKLPGPIRGVRSSSVPIAT